MKSEQEFICEMWRKIEWAEREELEKQEAFERNKQMQKNRILSILILSAGAILLSILLVRKILNAEIAGTVLMAAGFFFERMQNKIDEGAYR